MKILENDRARCLLACVFYYISIVCTSVNALCAMLHMTWSGCPVSTSCWWQEHCEFMMWEASLASWVRYNILGWFQVLYTYCMYLLFTLEGLFKLYSKVQNLIQECDLCCTTKFVPGTKFIQSQIKYVFTIHPLSLKKENSNIFLGLLIHAGSEKIA